MKPLTTRLDRSHIQVLRAVQCNQKRRLRTKVNAIVEGPTPGPNRQTTRSTKRLNARLESNMMENNKHADSIGAALLDRNDGLQEYRQGPGSNGVAFYVPEVRTGGGGQASG